MIKLKNMENIKYSNLNWDIQNASYGDYERQKLDIAFPKKERANAIIYIHGGAYFTGNKSEYPEFLSDYAKDNVIASIDYRVIEELNNIHMGDILLDLNNVIVKIIELSYLNNVKINELILIGHSAGGHIGLLYGYKYPMNIAACISLAGPTDFSDDLGWSSMPMWGKDMKERLIFMSWMGSRLAKFSIELKQFNWTKQDNYSIFEKYINEISPIMYVNKQNKIPPTLLVHARGDDQVPYSNAIRLKNALDNNNVINKLITPEGFADNHMLGGVVYKEASPIFFNCQWVNEAKTWLEGFL